MEAVAEQVSSTAEKVGSAVSKAADEVGEKAAQLFETVDENILDYCTLDQGVRRPRLSGAPAAAVLCAVRDWPGWRARADCDPEARRPRLSGASAAVALCAVLCANGLAHGHGLTVARGRAGEAAKGEEDAGREGAGLPGRPAGAAAQRKLSPASAYVAARPALRTCARFPGFILECGPHARRLT